MASLSLSPCETNFFFVLIWIWILNSNFNLVIQKEWPKSKRVTVFSLWFPFCGSCQLFSFCSSFSPQPLSFSPFVFLLLFTLILNVSKFVIINFLSHQLFFYWNETKKNRNEKKWFQYRPFTEITTACKCWATHQCGVIWRNGWDVSLLPLDWRIRERRQQKFHKIQQDFRKNSSRFWKDFYYYRIDWG